MPQLPWQEHLRPTLPHYAPLKVAHVMAELARLGLNCIFIRVLLRYPRAVMTGFYQVPNVAETI